jgi:DNA-binding NtrC family response regulator
MAEEHYKILVVDDQGDIREIISSILTARGHFCEHASNGLEALEKFNNEKYDAAIIDVVMPKMDGITLTKEIMKRNPEFPIMIMTGFAKDGYMGHPVNEEAISAGAIDFLEKPFTIEGFWLRFCKMMNNFRLIFQMKTYHAEIQKRSSEMIGSLQQESMEKIRALETEIEELKKKLQG